MAQELKVIADFYDFMLWLIQHTEKFPRHHRYSLRLAMKNAGRNGDLNKEVTEITERWPSVSSVSSCSNRLVWRGLESPGFVPVPNAPSGL